MTLPSYEREVVELTPLYTNPASGLHVTVAPDGKSIFVSKSNTIQRIDIVTGKVTGAWTHDSSLFVTAMDVGADGTSLYVAMQGATDRSGNVTEAISRLDIPGIAFTSPQNFTPDYSTTLTSIQSAGSNPPTAHFSDIVALSNGDLLLSEAGVVGSSPVVLLNHQTGMFTTALDNAKNATLASTPDQSEVLITTPLVAQGDLALYRAGTGIITQSGAPPIPKGQSTGASAISPDGSVIVTAIGSTSSVSDIYVYDSQLDYRTRIGAIDPEVVGRFGSSVTAMVFSPDGKDLYVYNVDALKIFDLSTSDWSVKSVIEADDPASEGIGLLAGMSISPNGRDLIYHSQLAVYDVDLTKVTPTPVLLGLSFKQSSAPGPESVTFMVGAIDNSARVTSLTLTLNHALLLADGTSTTQITITGTAAEFANGTATLNVPISSSAVIQNYHILSGVLTDAAGHSVTYSEAQLYAAVGATPVIQLADTVPPMLTRLALPGIVNVAGGGAIGHFGIAAFDGQDHLQTAIITLDRPYDPTRPSTNTITLSVGANDMAASDVLFTGNASPGVYTIIGVTVSESKPGLGGAGGGGNSATYNTTFLAQHGLPSTFTIENSTPVNAHTASDFNGDGHSDILWYNGTDSLLTDLVTGSPHGNQLQTSRLDHVLPTGAHVVATGDFNGDGKADLFIRSDATGVLSIWDSSGDGFTHDSYVNPRGGPTTDWTLAATGDLDGDGKADIIWRNSDGRFVSWHSTGTGFTQDYSATASSAWHIVGLADVNGDGEADLFWRNNTTGVVTIWASTGEGFNQNAIVDSSLKVANWTIDGLADFNGDGKADMLVRSVTGAVSIWQSTGSAFTPNVFKDSSMSNDWQVVQTGDFNNDGKADILWRNTTTGEFTTWESNGHGFDKPVIDSTSVLPHWTDVSQQHIFG